MEITVIHGSPRKRGNTYTAAQLFMAAMQRCGAVSFTEFFLPEAMPEFCRGCMSCVVNGEHTCPHAKYTLPALDAMLRADGLLFTSPVYVMAESGVMKAFLDHYPYLYVVHRARREMFAKKAFVLVTTLGAGAKNAIRTIAVSLRCWGVNRVYAAGFALHEVEWEKIPPKRKQKIESSIARRAAAFYREVASGKRRRPYLVPQGMYWFVRRMMPRYEDSSLDKQYWLAQGWLQRSPFRAGK